jgi:hypothetical protein
MEKDEQKMWTTFVIFKKQPKVNNHELGEIFAQSGHTGTYTVSVFLQLHMLIVEGRPKIESIIARFFLVLSWSHCNYVYLQLLIYPTVGS